MKSILHPAPQLQAVLREPQGVAFVLGVVATWVAEIRARREQPEAKEALRLEPDEVFMMRRWGDLTSNGRTVRERAQDVFKHLSMPHGQYDLWPKESEYEEVSEESMEQVIDAFDELLTEIIDSGGNPIDLFEMLSPWFNADVFDSSGIGSYMLAPFHLDLMLRMLRPQNEILDPFAFTGGTFVRAWHSMEGLFDTSFMGQESSLVAWRILKIHLLGRGLKSAKVRLAPQGCLLNNKFSEYESECVIARPSFGEGPWGQEQLLQDERWAFGVPPARRADYAYLQHAIYLLKPGGRAALVLPKRTLQSVLKEEKSIRKELLLDGCVECIISFPPGMFFFSRAESSIWILKRGINARSSAPKMGGDILFIDAGKMGRPVKELMNDSTAMQELVEVYHSWRRDGQVAAGRIAASIATSEVLSNDKISLNPAAYVQGES